MHAFCLLSDPRATILFRELMTGSNKYEQSTETGEFAIRPIVLGFLVSGFQGGIGRFQDFLYFVATNRLSVAVILGCGPTHGVSLCGAHMGFEEDSVLGAGLTHPLWMPLDAD